MWVFGDVRCKRIRELFLRSITTTLHTMKMFSLPVVSVVITGNGGYFWGESFHTSISAVGLGMHFVCVCVYVADSCCETHIVVIAKMFHDSIS